MGEMSGRRDEPVLRVSGGSPLEISLQSPPEWVEEAVSRESVGFECASGEWIEREYEALPVAVLIDPATFPGDTTHVQLESRDEYRACIPVTALAGAVIAVGDGDDQPRFVSPAVVGPRAMKNLASIRPLSLDAGEDREEHERLPID